ncbi:hypothetical protein NXX60_11015 [Bacteroides thetaiotaomicron]|nr:hypothetical protein NXX60_11015 [Bacteroides thetaiotaomicron]
MTSEPFRNIQVQITAEPDFGSITPVMMEAIPANNSVCLQSFSLVLSANYFAQVTERMSGSLKIEIRSEAETIFTQTYPIDILAYDQWGGINIFPEMLAAFITPNHAVLTPIIKRAAAILEQWTGTPSLDEYQSRNPDRVRKQMAAIYTALTEQQIIYSTIPARLRRARAACPADRFRTGTKARNLSGYGTALYFLPRIHRTECPHRHHQRACFRRRLAGAGNLSGPCHRRCILADQTNRRRNLRHHAGRNHLHEYGT